MWQNIPTQKQEKEEREYAITHPPSFSYQYILL